MLALQLSSILLPRFSSIPASMSYYWRNGTNDALLLLKKRLLYSSATLFIIIPLTVKHISSSSVTFFKRPFSTTTYDSLPLKSQSKNITMDIYWTTIVFLVAASILSPTTHADLSCRSYCSNLTVDYPFALRFGCGHPGFRDLLFCINNYLMLHLPSGSYRVLGIDYSFRSLTLHDPHLSNCLTLSLGRRANGFFLEPWRSPYLSPVPDNAFLLLGCSPRSPLFQGFPTRRLPCRNVSGISCEDYYQCPGWSTIGRRWGPPECCALPFQAIKEMNLSKLECEGYSSAYSLAPLRVGGAHQWSYGIRVKYSVQGSEEFCRACEATGGTCGFTGGRRCS